VAFWVDLLSATFTNLLFLDIQSSDTFVFMILFDVGENIFHSFRGSKMLRDAKIRIKSEKGADTRSVARSISKGGKEKMNATAQLVKEQRLLERRRAFNYVLSFGFNEVSSERRRAERRLINRTSRCSLASLLANLTLLTCSVAEVCSSFVSTTMIFSLSKWGHNYDYNSLVDAGSYTCHNDLTMPLTYAAIDAVIEVTLFVFVVTLVKTRFKISVLDMLSVLIVSYREYMYVPGERAK